MIKKNLEFVSLAGHMRTEMTTVSFVVASKIL